MTLEGKVAIVTGAGRGLGRAHALALAGAGAKIVVNDLGGSASGQGRDAWPAKDVASEINEGGGTAIADGADVSSWLESARLIEQALGRFGRLDILVCNAGICRPTSFGQLTQADCARLMDVNAGGTLALIEAATRHWLQVGPEAGRAIVCTASPAGALPHPPLGIYGVSKAAVLAIAQVAAEELAHLGVRVNALAPVARTRMMAAAMEGQPVDLDKIMPRDASYDLYDPDHVARLVLYLVSPLCPYTGRLFGVRADDVYVYEGWTASHHVGNSGKAWSVDTLAAALASVPLQDSPKIIGPMGRLAASFPSDRVRAAFNREGDGNAVAHQPARLTGDEDCN